MPEGYIPKIEGIGVGLGSARITHRDGYIAFHTNAQIQEKQMPDTGEMTMFIGAVSYGGDYIRSIQLDRIAQAKLYHALGTNRRVLGTVFMPQGIKLSPLDGSEPIIIADGRSLRLDGREYVITTDTGTEQRLNALDYSFELLVDNTKKNAKGDADDL